MDDTQREKLAEFRQKASERDTAEQEASDLRELESHELVATLETKGLKHGSDFEIINNRLGGVYAIRKPDGRAIRNWEQASEKNKLSLEWQIGLLRHYIEPQDKAVLWAQTCAQRPGLCWQTADRFVEMMSVDREGLARK